jgi:hypothetical protein
MTRRGGLRLAELQDRIQGDYADSGEAEPLDRKASPLRMTSRSVVVNWHCACGREYRVRTESLTFWPRTSHRAFRAEPTTTCVDCGADLEEPFALDAARLVSAAMLG